MSLFRKKDGPATGKDAAGSRPRASRGWVESLAYLKSASGLRVLDFGPTSPANINFLTSLGHSVYMADIVQDAARKEWYDPAPAGAKGGPLFNLERFRTGNLDFSNRPFDVILLWDTANYLPADLVAPMFERLNELMNPSGKLLAFFHGKADGQDTRFSRYAIADADELLVQPAEAHAIQNIYQTRQIENFLHSFADVRFLLGKDNVREVIATR